jgi:multiple sugar transport system substrate-binding protein
MGSRLARVGACLGLAVLMLPGHAALAARPADATSIRVWNYATGEEQKVFQTAYDAFGKAQTGVQVAASWGVDTDKILTAISGGTPPDVVDLGGEDQLCSWAAKGALTDLTPYIKSSHIDTSQFVPQALSSSFCNGKEYGLPGAFDGLFLYYNTDILAKAHVTPPHTIAQLDQDAAKLTVESGGKISQLGFVPNGGISGDNGLQVWAYTFGGNWWDPKTHAITPSQAGNVAALTWEQSYYKRYGAKALSTFNGASYGSGALGSDPFAFGKVAMEVGGEWLNAFLRNYAPSIHFGEVPLPVLRAGNKPAMYTTGDVWFIPSTAPHKDAAWQFISWLEQPSHYAPVCNGMVNLPQFNSLYNNDSWASPALKTSIGLWKQYNVFAMPQLPNFVQYETMIANAEQQATLGSSSPADALNQIAGQLGNH